MNLTKPDICRAASARARVSSIQLENNQSKSKGHHVDTFIDLPCRTAVQKTVTGLGFFGRGGNDADVAGRFDHYLVKLVGQVSYSWTVTVDIVPT